MKFLRKSIFFLLLALSVNIPVLAQTPSPTPNPSGTPAQTQVAMTFAESLQSFTDEAIAARSLFINQIEKPLSGWIYTLAQLLALIMFGWAIAQAITTNGGFSGGDITRIGLRCAVGFLLLFFAGDIDGDGNRGDLINYPASVGYYYAYGVSENGTVEGSFLNKKTVEQETKFNEGYNKFVNNKFMVQVSGKDIPVHYPTTKDVNLLAALYTGKPLSQQEIDEAKSREWQMSMLFGFFTFSRGVLSFADFFLFFISGFAVIVLRLALPLMIGSMFHKEYGQKITVSFFWTAFVWTIIYPGITQFIRLLAYSAGNVAMGLGGDNPYFKFDPTSGKIIANGNPEIIILISALYMLFSALCLFASFYISMYFSQGKILEGIVSTTSAWFTAATSVGVSAVTGAVSSRMQMESDRTSAQGQMDTSMAEAGFTKTIQENSAKNSNATSKLMADTTAQSQATETVANKRAEDMMTNASFQNASIGAYAGFVDKVANLKTEQYQSKANALMNWRQEWDNLDSKERQEKMSNFLDLYSKNGDAVMKERIQAIKDNPAELDLLGKEMDMYLKGIPVVGSGLNALGINGEAANTWLRTDAGKMAIGTLLSNGNPNAGTMNMLQQYNTKDGLGGILGDKSISDAMKQDSEFAKNYEGTQQAQFSQFTPSRSSVNQPSFSVPKGAKGGLSKEQFKTAAVLNDQMVKKGWTPQARQVMLGEFGRENGFRSDVISNGHIDDKNHKVNAGIISWQGDRRDALFNYMGNRGFVTSNGRLVNSEASLRAQVDFMDQEMRGGNGFFRTTHKMLTNPNFSQKDIAFRMGGKNGFIGYNNTDSKYHNAGDPIFASPNSAKWANKSFGLVNATSQPGTFKFGSSQQYGKVNSALSSISMANPEKAKILAAQYSRNIERDFQLEQNRRMFDGKNQIATQFYTEQKVIADNKLSDTNEIADNVAGMRYNAAQTNYDYTMKGAQVMRDAGYGATDTRYQGKMQSIGITKDGQYAVADMNMANEMKNAQLAYQSRQVASSIQFEAANKSSHLRAMSQMMQNLGSSVGHQVAEASEKFSRV